MRSEFKSDFLDKVSDKQAAVIFDVVFGNSAEQVSEILERRGVSRNEYAKWLADGTYAECLLFLSERAAAAEEASVWRSLTDAACGGGVQAIKLFFELMDKRRSGEAPVSDDFDEIKARIFGEDAGCEKNAVCDGEYEL